MKIFNTIVKNKNEFTFLLLGFIYLITNLFYYIKNTPIFPNGGPQSEHFCEIFFSSWSASPLLIINKILFYFFSFQHFDLIIIVENFIFFIITLYFINKILILIKNRDAGFYGMILFSFTPAIYGLSKIYGRGEFQILPFLVISIYLFIKNKDFYNKKYSLLLAIFLSLGFLIRQTIFIFILYWPLSFILKIFLNKTKKQNIFNFILFISTIIFILILFLFKNRLLEFLILLPFAEKEIIQLTSIKIITFDISTKLLSLPIYILFLLSVLLIKKEERNKIIPIILNILFSMFLFFILPHNKQEIYFVPLIPYIVISISFFFSSYFSNKNLAKILFICISICLLYQFILLSFFIEKRNFINLTNNIVFFFDYKSDIFNINYTPFTYKGVHLNERSKSEYKQLALFIKELTKKHNICILTPAYNFSPYKLLIFLHYYNVNHEKYFIPLRNLLLSFYKNKDNYLNSTKQLEIEKIDCVLDLSIHEKAKVNLDSFHKLKVENINDISKISLYEDKNFEYLFYASVNFLKRYPHITKDIDLKKDYDILKQKYSLLFNDKIFIFEEDINNLEV